MKDSIKKHLIKTSKLGVHIATPSVTRTIPAIIQTRMFLIRSNIVDGLFMVELLGIGR
jgi:hypothetical protein